MLKFAAITITALGASTAFAQAPAAAPSAAPMDGTATTAQPTTAQPATAQPAPAQPGAATNSGTTAADTTTAQATPATNANAQVVAVVEAGFPKYDADKDGKLSEAEFKQWISDLKAQELAAQGKPADPAAVSQYATAALAVADRDKDGVVTKQDLTTFLGG